MTSARLLVAVGMMIATACGGAPKGEPSRTPAAPSAGGADDGGSAASTPAGNAAPAGGTPMASGDATGPVAPAASSAASTPASAPAERTFAKTPEEATTMIDEAVNSRAAELSRCVADLRTRKKDAHAKVTVEIGIDQEGHLLGVKTPKGHTEDKALNMCVQGALRGAPFPRSHSGVITLKKTFEDSVVYR